MTEAKSAQPQLPRKDGESWFDYLQRSTDSEVIEHIEKLEAENESLKVKVEGMKHGPEFYSYTPGAISDVRLEGMIDETRWWKVPGDEVYEVVRELKQRRAENESLKAAKPLRMFVWDGRGAYKISVCAGSVADARELALAEITFRGMAEIEGSPMFRAKAQVMQEQPHIYLRPNAEVVLSENGETEELNLCLESESANRQSAESQLAAMKAECDTLRSEAIENARIIGMSGSREAALLAENKSLKDEAERFLTQAHNAEGNAVYQQRRAEKAESERNAHKTQFEDHTKHVAAFLNEMYAIMVDPVDEWDGGNVSELCRNCVRDCLRLPEN